VKVVVGTRLADAERNGARDLMYRSVGDDCRQGWHGRGGLWWWAW
jgi:hypothetical protein